MCLVIDIKSDEFICTPCQVILINNNYTMIYNNALSPGHCKLLLHI